VDNRTVDDARGRGVFLNANDAKNANFRKKYVVYNQQYTKLIYSFICENLRFLRHLRSKSNDKNAKKLTTSPQLGDILLKTCEKCVENTKKSPKTFCHYKKSP